MKKNFAGITFFLGLALFSIGQTLHGQQNETDAKQLADIRAKAEKGEAKAQFKLGMTLFAGDLGATSDDKEAVKWIRKAADQNDVEAQNLLGDCYISARGVAANSAEAARWYRKAAEQGDALSQSHLANLYENGDGVVKDITEAVNWNRKAAEQGQMNAQFNLARMYYTGEGLPKDVAESLKWFTKAAEQGEHNSQINLSTFYAQGIGVPENKTESLAWMIVAALSGNETAIKYTAHLRAEVRPSGDPVRQRTKQRDFKANPIR